MNYRLQIYVSGSWSLCQRSLQDCEQILLSKFEHQTAPLETYKDICSIAVHSQWGGISFYLGSVSVYLSTSITGQRAKHDCRPFSAAAESPGEKEIYSWLSSAYTWWGLTCPEDYGKAFNKILHRCLKMYLPDDSSSVALAITFSSFFINKLSIIRSSFPSDSHSRVLNPPDTKKVLQDLTCVTADGVHHLVPRAPCKSSDLDPIPPSLMKDCIDIFITLITSIINLSLSEGSFLLPFKSAHDSPILKKPSSIRIAWIITGQCPISASLSRCLRK